MLTNADSHPRRRDFLGQLGAAAAALFAPPIPSDGRHVPMHDSAWDLSWVDRLKDVPYRVVFDANDVADGFALDLAVMFLDQYHEVYGTRDDQARAVIVMRQLGTPLALGDALWDRYAIGEEIKVKDPATHSPRAATPFSERLRACRLTSPKPSWRRCGRAGRFCSSVTSPPTTGPRVTRAWRTATWQQSKPRCAMASRQA